MFIDLDMSECCPQFHVLCLSPSHSLLVLPCCCPAPSTVERHRSPVMCSQAHPSSSRPLLSKCCLGPCVLMIVLFISPVSEEDLVVVSVGGGSGGGGPSGCCNSAAFDFSMGLWIL